MSGPVERWAGRVSTVGAATVRRALPKRGHRTVGAWCFADHFRGTAVDIGPHPHIGLQTVTWLLDGEVLHRDSLGSEQVIRPGQLNLMTSGHGVAHAEESPPGWHGTVHGMQLWVAQPEATRHGAPAFEHHSLLPVHELGTATATELVGPASPARRDTDHVGWDVALRPGATALPVEADHEHAVIVLDGQVRVSDESFAEDELAYLVPGRGEIVMEATASARVLVLGGSPFDESIEMWWNFVARTDDEMRAARQAWEEGHARFGPVASGLARITAPEV